MFSSTVWEEKNTIFVRSFIGFLLKIVQFTSMKDFKLTTVAVINQMSPLFTVILANLILKESIRGKDFIAIFISFLAVVLITFGMDYSKKKVTVQTDGAEYARYDNFYISSFLCLIFVPIGFAFCKILARKLRKINSNTVSCYVNPFMMVGSCITLVAIGSDAY